MGDNAIATAQEITIMIYSLSPLANGPLRYHRLFHERDAQQKRVMIIDIQRAVAKHYHVKRKEILSHDRSKHIVIPRHVAIYLACALSPLSMPVIGRLFGGLDHTTVLHAARRIAAACTIDPDLADTVEQLRDELVNGDHAI